MANLLGLPRPPFSEGTLRYWWRAYRANGNGRLVSIRLFDRVMPVPDVSVDAWRLFERFLHSYRYPASRDFWTYVVRYIGNTTTWSLHAYGIAGDKDPRRNPYKPSARWTDTLFTPALVRALLAVRTNNGKQVFAWGGQWARSQDLMHWYLVCKPSDLVTGIDPDTVALVDGEEGQVIQNGATGPAVVRLQEALMLAGYELPEWGADGTYGSETTMAVTAYQQDMGLEATGVCDGVTVGFLIPGPPGPQGIPGRAGETPDLTKFALTPIV